MKDSETDHPQDSAAPNSQRLPGARASVAQKSRERFESQGAAARDDDAVNGVEEVKGKARLRKQPRQPLF